MSALSCSHSAYVEITDQCYGSCLWCYKKGIVSPKGKHVPLERLIARINWIIKNVECEEIVPIGGEPLLHPNFIEICDHIISTGKRLSIVTAGMLSRRTYEKKNLEYALELYKKGKLVDINLSLQPGRNEKQYLKILVEIKKIYHQSREAREDLGIYHTKDQDLYTTVVVDKTYLKDKQKFLDLINFLRTNSGFTAYDSNNKTFLEMCGHLEAHFSEFEISHDLNYSMWQLDEFAGFRHKLNFRGEVETTRIDGISKVRVPQGGMCEAQKIKVENDVIKCEGLMVRSDGEVCIPTPQCIPVASGLCSADIHDGNSVYQTVKNSLSEIHKLVYLANRRKALAKCKPDMQEEDCTACPFDDMCNACHAIVRKWN